MSLESATILASQVRTLQSKHTGSEYRISIALPYAYYEVQNPFWPFDKPLEKWPVVYLTDANFYFGLVTDMVRSMAWCGSPTDAIIVGIGYVEEGSPQEMWSDLYIRRAWDLTPVRDEKDESNISEWLKREVKTGGAGEFLQFIKQDLIPVIEYEFNADPKRRVLFGHSYGGLFTTFALCEDPALFESYIIGSPSLAYGDRYIFKLEEQISKRHKELPSKVYLFAGELEEKPDDPVVSDVIRFGALLESRKHQGLILTKQIFVNENHCEVIGLGLQAGLKFALEKERP